MKLKYLLPVLLAICTFSFANAQSEKNTTEAILKEAYAKAATENKKVFVIFHASWCGWCHKLDSSMNDMACKKMFQTNFVIVHLTVDESKDKKNLETPGADAFRAKYHGEVAGLPFFLIFDKDGKLLADSKIRKPGESLDLPGDNMGCPASKEEVAYFVNVVLKQTTGLKDSQLKIIEERFSKNK